MPKSGWHWMQLEAPDTITTAARTCKVSDGPTTQTVQQAIALVPIPTAGSIWVEIGWGHTRNCRLYWVQTIPTIATESIPQQSLFFDHNILLGAPTRNPKPLHKCAVSRRTIR